MTAPDTEGRGERWGWCPADDCPTSVCGGVHREVLTSLGIEIVRDGQQPIGTPKERPRNADR